ncbi:MAG: polysaccharide biosynthesis/export family protein [Luteolibacter sp.]|uniref:SLBB domain-containing protein n=1 Tax=Luteolibacter sp. TaxID=1962973 RepID=UPI0032651D69
MSQDRSLLRLLPLTCLYLLSSCTYMSQTGPQKSAIEGKQNDFQLIDVKSKADLPGPGRSYGSGEKPPQVKGGSYSDKVRTRDALHFVITDLTEQSPFYTRGEPYDFGPIEVPEDGRITIPYAGEIQVMNQSLSQISASLNEKLKPISNTAQASVGRSNRIARTANVIGEVKTPGPVPLERNNISSLDLLAASGGPVEAEHLYKYTLRRNSHDYTFDYQGFRQRSFPVEEGDLLSVSTDMSNRFYVMGAIMKPTTVPFPVPAPTLADALGAAAGFDVRTSDPSGVFVFRKGNPDQVYTLNLKDPGIMFLTQRFPIRGEDLVYVTEAPLARWSRLISQLLPFSQLSQAAYNVDRISR